MTNCNLKFTRFVRNGLKLSKTTGTVLYLLSRKTIVQETLPMPVGISVSVALCSRSTFMIFTAFQRLVDSDDCPAPVSCLAFGSVCEFCGFPGLEQV